LYEVINEVIAK